MFWRFGGYANISTLDSILDKPDVTIEELLDESDLIQELKQQNSKLIQYLRDDKILERLLQFVIAPPSPAPQQSPGTDNAAEGEGDEKGGAEIGSFFKRRSRSRSIKSDSGENEEGKEEKQRLKYAYVACEILSSEVWSISEALLENQAALRKFWDYLKQPAPLDPVQAGYFTKVNESLLDRKTEEMLEFFKSIDGIVSDMLQHVDCPMVMDLLLKIISLEKAEGGQGIVDVGTSSSTNSEHANFWATVASAAQFDSHPPVVPVSRLQCISPNIRRRFPEGHHYHLCQRYHPGPDCHWPQRIDETAGF